MTNTKNKKSAKQKRVLAAAIVLAAIITVGATFAWFTSSDTVTNKLSASGSYGVSVTETFTPIDDWTPGQAVNKDVFVVNTGNIDAYVKVSLSNAIDLVVYGTSEDYSDSNTANYVTLSTDEVTSLQAGGRLVCKAGTAVTNEADQLEGTGYLPTTTGLYVFARKISTAQNGTVTYEYVGYYYVAATSSDTGGQGTYYQIDTITHATSPTESYSANLIKTESVYAQDLTFSSTIQGDASNGYYITATYSSNANSTADDIVIYIYLDDYYATNWTSVYDSTAGDWTFYYNYILASGSTSEELIDSLVLSSSTQSDAYVSFDYSLNVTADSVQVTYDEDGNISNAAEIGENWEYISNSPITTTDGTATDPVSVTTWETNTSYTTTTTAANP